MQSDKDITLMKYKPEAKEIHITGEEAKYKQFSIFTNSNYREKIHTDLHCQNLLNPMRTHFNTNKFHMFWARFNTPLPLNQATALRNPYFDIFLRLVAFTQLFHD